MLVLVRHGQSEWNLENRFTGWVDVSLTAQGLEEAHRAGRALKSAGYQFDELHTSYLKRAIKTAWIVLEELGQEWIPQYATWKLNERHYGGLQGLNKAETAAKYGDDQVKLWRRSYDVLPPVGGDNSALETDRRYQGVKLPQGEALKQTVDRVMPYWNEAIAPSLKAGKNVLVVAHGNSLRALVKHISGMGDQDIVGFEFETGVPLVCELNSDLKLTKKTFLK
jgi:2,3-bisphosphoglycerate-dependent phosphoglycerate mutase